MRHRPVLARTSLDFADLNHFEESELRLKLRLVMKNVQLMEPGEER